jgi:hypothetical protein
VRKTCRELRLFREVLDIPRAFRVEQKSLSDDPRLSAELRRRSIGGGSLRTARPFDMKEEPGQFDVRVPEAVDDCDAAALQDLPSLSGCLIGDQEQASIRSSLRVMDELPRGGRIRTLFEFDGHGRTIAGEVEDGIDPAIGPAGLGRNREPWDLS